MAGTGFQLPARHDCPVRARLSRGWSRLARCITLGACGAALAHTGVGCMTADPSLGVPSTQRYTGPTDPLEVVLAGINQRADRIKTLNAVGYWEGNLGAKRGELSFLNGQVVLLHTKPDKVRLQLDKAGIPGHLFDMGTDGQVFWLRLDNQRDPTTVWHGKVRPTGEAPTQELPIRPELLLDVIGIAAYNLDLTAEPVPTLRFNPEYDVYMLMWHARGQGDRWRTLREVWFDRQTLRPRAVFLFDAHGRIVVRAHLSDFAPISAGGGQDASGETARQFDILFPETDSRLKITLESVRDRRIGAPNELTYRVDPVLRGAQRVIDLDAVDRAGASRSGQSSGWEGQR